MRPRVVGVGIACVAIMAMGWMPQAWAGGGCHAGATTADATNEDGATVEMIDACFTPTTLRVEEGASVTFVSRDEGITHNVGGNVWGHFEEMSAGDAFMATFDDPGTYPYACSYHPGMTGAIIVGDGLGAANGETVTLRDFVPPEPEVRVVTRSVAARAPATGWIVGGAIGVLLGIAGGVVLARARRTASG